MEWALPLLRVRHAVFLSCILAFLVFITGFFAYYVGAFAGPIVLFAGVIIFHRCETWDLLRYGVHPCFGALCNMTPYGEIETARMILVMGMFVTLGSAIASAVALFSYGEDWRVALAICCLVFSVLSLLASLGSLISLQNALGFVATEIGGAIVVDAAVPPTHPAYYQQEAEFSSHRSVPVQPTLYHDSYQRRAEPPARQYYVVQPTRSPIGSARARYHDPYD